MSLRCRHISTVMVMAIAIALLRFPSIAFGAEAVKDDVFSQDEGTAEVTNGLTSTPDEVTYADDSYDSLKMLGKLKYPDLPNPQHKLDGAGMMAYSSSVPYWSGSTFYNADGTVYLSTAIKVIDVSEHQGVIDWESVKAAGIDAAIIRLGYGTGYEDKYLERNLQECERLGISYGLYLYSYAYTSSQAQEEAKWTAALIEQYGADPDLPVFYDLEEWTWTGHKPPTSASTYEAIVDVYFDELESKGVNNVAIYSYTSYLNGPLNTKSIWKRTAWVAQYGSRLTFSNPYEPDWHGWQYTSSGSVSGISGNVDMSAFVPITAPETGVPGWYELCGNTYYYDENGNLVTGWFEVDGKRYYAESDGALHYGWLDLGGRRYRLDKNNGRLWTGWFTVDGKRYYAESDGALHYGWLDLDGRRYRMDKNYGYARVGFFTVDGKRYYGTSDGSLHYGWLRVDGKRYRMDINYGYARTGWFTVSGRRYYGSSDGSLVLGWLDLDGRRYRMDKNKGYLWTGWFTVDGKRYYADSNGVVS